MSIRKDCLYFPGNATVKEVLRTFLDRNGDWWFLLVTERDGEHYVCSFGSLLPYLTGRTPHIVHSIGDCPICTGMDPLLWSETGMLCKEAMVDEAIHGRFVSTLPMAKLPVVEVQGLEATEAEARYMMQGNVCGVLENGVLSGVYIVQVKGGLGEFPSF